MIGRRAAVAILAVVLIAGGTFLAFIYVGGRPSACSPLGASDRVTSRPVPRQVGGIQEYLLPDQGRMANGIAAAPDGSVWFGEESVPGVGHLMGNGSLVEYKWPGSTFRVGAGACDFKTSIWGVAIWNGMVWATDGDFNGIIGLNPIDGSTMTVNVSASRGFPYTLSVGPDGALWFTLLSTPATIGRVSPDFTVSYFKIAGLTSFLSAELEFMNGTTAYLAAIDSLGGPGRLIAFDPGNLSNPIVARPVGQGFNPASPTSVSSAGGLVWVTQHGGASVAAYNSSSGIWRTYPTSVVNYSLTTLPYFVRATGSDVWFNEHYGNKIARIDTASGTLAELSEANPPVSDLRFIENDLTIALGSNGLWFTSTTGNYIGFVPFSYQPAFSIALRGQNDVSVARGGSTTISLTVQGDWRSSLTFGASDDESPTSTTSRLTAVPSLSSLPAGTGPVGIQVTISASSLASPGSYVMALTMSAPLEAQSVYVEVTVT